eukprot:TRINITY_DN3221_c0_g1_i1.p4 TRINITY_DN3221_c0_g1~~TRINITY_DN3221_c0_g1_i1.p4  ORF type:complete len:191 (+),score=58.09 TRINITY_DN3221_c0_g1_i1:182-754(+)
MKSDVPKVPMLFLKPPSSYIKEGMAIVIPDECDELHHEVELGIVIGTTLKKVDNDEQAMEGVAGYALCLDMTARNIQSEAKKKGHPWSVAKGYDTFLPVSDFIEKDQIADPHNIDLWCSVDDEIKQSGNTSDMIFNIPTLIRYISGIMTLEAGDLICSGTPEGVGPVVNGQVIKCGLGDVMEMTFKVGEE